MLAPTLLVGLSLGAFLVVDARSLADDVATADAAAQEYDAALDDYRAALVGDLADVDAGDPDAVAEVVAGRAQERPSLAGVPARGEDESSRYQAARSEAADLATASARLSEVVEQNLGATAFVAAATRALELDPASLTAGGAVADGSPLRRDVIPPMRAALAEFEAVRSPARAAEARSAVSAALQHVIDEAERLAAMLDAGQGGSFTFAEEYTRAQRAVQELDDGVRADLREALDGVVVDPTVRS